MSRCVANHGPHATDATSARRCCGAAPYYWLICAQVHNPEKLDNIDAFLDEAGPGNEEVLLEAIQDKYGVPRS